MTTITTAPTTFGDQVRASLRDPHLFATLTITPDGAAKVKAELLGIKADLKAQRMARVAYHPDEHDETQIWLAKQASFERHVDKALAQCEVITHDDWREQRIRNLMHVVQTLTAGIVAHQDDEHEDGPDDDALYGLLDQLTVHTGDRGILTLRHAHATRPTATEAVA